MFATCENLKPAHATDIMAMDVDYDSESLTRPLPPLPAELLAKIFTYTVQMEGWATLDVGHGPWVLTQINRFWRAVVLRMPELWSRLHLELDENPVPSQLLCEVFLQNSGSYPLELSIHTPFEFDSHPILDLLLSTASNRWKAAHLRVPVELVQSMSPYASQFAQLETLSIRVPSMACSPKVPIPRVDTFALAPKLRNVYVVDTSFDIDLPLPWTQLTSYAGDISYFSQNAFNSLWSATNLTQLEVHLSLTYPDPSDKHTTFPFLRKMKLVVEEGCDIDHLLRYGTFPALQVLDISVVQNDDQRDLGEFNMESVVEMVERSACPLTRLSIIKDEMTEEEIIPLFVLTPHLVELNIGGAPSPYSGVSSALGGVGPDVIRAMTWSKDVELLPRLQVLSVQGVFDKDLFSEMVLSRMTCAHEKKYLHSLFMAVGADRMAEVKEVIQRGVNALPHVFVTIVPHRIY